MRTRHWQILLLVTASAVPLGRAEAQASTSDPSAAARLSSAVLDRPRIRVLLRSDSTVELRDPRVDGTTLIGTSPADGRVTGYRIDEIERVSRPGSSAALGFGVGASLGVAGGAVGGMLLANFCPWGSCAKASGSEQRAAVVKGALVGGLAAGTIGLLLGAPFTRWTSVFEPHRQPVTVSVRGGGLGIRVSF
jgi:hypothetical protein